jgi:hypothetical protein
MLSVFQLVTAFGEPVVSGNERIAAASESGYFHARESHDLDLVALVILPLIGSYPASFCSSRVLMQKDEDKGGVNWQLLAVL